LLGSRGRVGIAGGSRVCRPGRLAPLGRQRRNHAAQLLEHLNESWLRQWSDGSSGAGFFNTGIRKARRQEYLQLKRRSQPRTQRQQPRQLNGPDPLQRAALVDAFLQNNGLTRTTLARGGFLTSNVTVQSRQDLSFALLGVRGTVLISAFRNDARLVTPASGASGDLAGANSLLQSGASINLSHRLTPLSAVSVDLSRTRTSGGVADEHTSLQSLTVTWTSRLAERVDLSVSARRSSFDSATDPYSESALIANLRVQF